jgi:HPt (histidine-containing phosphotransfer) domain-containing protein
MALDSEVVASLKALATESGDAGFLVQLATTFVGDTEKRLGAIRAALAGGDAATAGREGHTLKSASAGVGAMAFSALCKELELAGKAGAVADSKTVFTKIEAAWPALKTEVQRQFTGG